VTALQESSARPAKRRYSTCTFVMRRPSGKDACAPSARRGRRTVRLLPQCSACCYVGFVKTSTLSVGDVIEVVTERLAYGGEAVARYSGLAVFIPFAAPKEKLLIRITEQKKNFARAVIERVLEPSAFRREPPCLYFGDCGGCQLQHLTYEAQLESKVGFVRDALQRIGRIDWPFEIKIRSAAEFGYRGRTQVTIDWQSSRVGFNRARSNAVCDVETCPILLPELDQALALVREAVVETRGSGHPESRFSQIEMAASGSSVALEPPIAGPPKGPLQQVVRDAVYSFGPATFFQSNARLLDDLIDEAVDQSSADSGELALDLYAGVGLFTIQMARRFKHVIGVESDPGTAKFALENIGANELTNVEFHTSRVEAWLKRYLDSEPVSPDLLLLDPPRTGAAESIALVAQLKPSRITYVSCDPTTLARDLRLLLDSGYELSRITAIDLFPQTYHIETVAALRLT
jgi:23S rRNA (uracil1939-C5)-methyltransferase